MTVLHDSVEPVLARSISSHFEGKTLAREIRVAALMVLCAVIVHFKR